MTEMALHNESIRLIDLCVCFPIFQGSVKAVDHVNVVFRDGEITGIIGESGCGKSVLGMAILRLLPPYARVDGQIVYQDRDLLALSPREFRKIRGKRLGLIPQNPADSLNPVRRIGGQIREGLPETVCGQKSRSAAARQLLARFGFSEGKDVWNAYPFQLSGGMQQRAALAVGMAGSPKWMVADEPTKGLDRKLREQMYENLRMIQRQSAGGMLMITHDLTLAETICDSTAVMYSGEIIEQGKTVIQNPLHPYTQGLLASLPQHGLCPMEGEAPKPWEDIWGCKFAARCPHCRRRCRKEKPEEYEAGRSKVRCFLYA